MQNFKLNAMKIKKEQFSDRMKAVVLLLALACVNGYAQENNSSTSLRNAFRTLSILPLNLAFTPIAYNVTAPYRISSIRRKP